MERYLLTQQSEEAIWQRRAEGEGAECTRHISGFVDGARAYALRQAANKEVIYCNAQAIFARAPGDYPAVIDTTGNPKLNYLDVTRHIDTLSMYFLSCTRRRVAIHRLFLRHNPSEFITAEERKTFDHNGSEMKSCFLFDRDCPSQY